MFISSSLFTLLFFFFFFLMIRRPPRSTLFPLHDALPIWSGLYDLEAILSAREELRTFLAEALQRYPTDSKKLSQDRKSTRLNSSHRTISYAVFCLKKKKK